ncbi:hypothetical protein BX600DRAFT_279677 [Xylariales sp. PMI_506]|nr:hypothetical protein BX600DRAFT_279677 [Xylariales sp. PMI_506]
MASGQFFDPLTLLRVAPLVASTYAIRFSVDQYMFLEPFTLAQHRREANDILPSYWNHQFPKGLASILFIYPVAIATGIANFYGRPNGAWQWYTAGSVLAMAHFPFVLKIMWPVKALYDADPKDGESTVHLQKWLNIHVVRSVLTDLPQWVCFFVAALKSLQPI